MEKEIILKVIEVGLPLVFGFISGYWIQKLKNRPKIVTHGCRISNQDVYTYFRPDNTSSQPACPYLSEDEMCNFPIGTDQFKKHMLLINGGKCYLAFWDKQTK